MGSFNVSCSLSNVGISYNDPCYYVILMPHWSPNTNIPDSLIGYDKIPAYEGAIYQFAPYLMPILGKYDGGGCIKPNPNDPSLTTLERIFKCKASDFFDDPCAFDIPKPEERNHPVFEKIDKTLLYTYKLLLADLYRMPLTEKPGEPKKKMKVSGCFFHKWAWELAVKHEIKSLDAFGTSCWKDFPYSQVLELIGFKRVGSNQDAKTEEDKRFNAIYKMDNNPDTEIRSDDTWGIIYHRKKRETTLYSIQDLFREWRKLNGTPLADNATIDMLKTTWANSIVNWPKVESKILFKNMVREYPDRLSKMIEEGVYDHEKVKREIEDFWVKYQTEKWMYGGTPFDTMALRYSEEFGLEPVKKHLYKVYAEFAAVTRFMDRNSRLLQPVTTPPQDCAKDAELALAKATIKYIEKRFKMEQE